MPNSVDLVIRQSGQPERWIRLREGTLRIGRSEDNDIILSDTGISRHHGTFTIHSGQVVFKDLGSGNGTWYQGKRVTSQRLDDGEELRIDPFTLQIRMPTVSRSIGALIAQPRLERTDGPGGPSSWGLGRGVLTIGRGDIRDIILSDPSVSRHHCNVVQKDTGWWLQDISGTNGIYINGERIQERQLGDGDRIRIGGTELRFSVGDPSQLDSNTQSALAVDDLKGTTVPIRIPTASRQGAWLILFVGLLASFLATGVVALVIILTLGYPAGPMVIEIGGPSAPRWFLNYPVSNETSLEAIETQGIDALRKGNNQAALEFFHRVLILDPGRPSAERLAFAAAEYRILEAMAAHVKGKRVAEQQAVFEKSRLLMEMRAGGSRRTNAITALERDFRDDSEVSEFLGWKPGPIQKQIDTQLAAGTMALHSEHWSDAISAFESMRVASQDAMDRQQALDGQLQARRQLAGMVSKDWREAILAEKQGDVETARKLYSKILQTDSRNPSARLRLARLKED